MENKKNDELDENIEELRKNKEINLDTELLQLKNELKLQKDVFLRIAAEYDNYRKRTEKDKLTIYKDAIIDTASKILPISDSIETALKSCENMENQYIKGLELIEKQINSVFKKLEIEPFGNIGDSFDPELHNAISHDNNDKFQKNVLMEIFQKGYKIKDKIIRHAMVKVAN